MDERTVTVWDRIVIAAGPLMLACLTVPAAAQEATRFVAGHVFRDCAACPELVVVSAGSFLMGSPPSEEGWYGDEGTMHRVTFSQSVAAGKYEVTFDEWDACVASGGCGRRPDDRGWGRGRRPVIDVSWEDAQAYAVWLRRETGAPYRLLSESD